MTTYFIGDVHGCYKELKSLLSDISFNPKVDELWFSGDIVNKGPQSYEVISYIMDLQGANTVLGNHDMHLLALSQGLLPSDKPHNLENILNSPNVDEIIAWLRSRKFIHKEGASALVHAGIHHTWSIAEAISYSNELSLALQGDDWVSLLNSMYGDTPTKWSKSLKGQDRTRCLINIFTRMRFLTPDLELEFGNVGSPKDNKNLIPWYDIENEKLGEDRIFFGHWSMLNGKSNNKQCVAIDGGCVYGGTLIAKDITKCNLK